MGSELFYCLPLFIRTLDPGSLKAWAVCRGVTLELYTGRVQQACNKALRGMSILDHFGPSHVIVVDDFIYRSGAVARIRAEGTHIQSSQSAPFFEPEPMIRLVSLALFLAGGHVPRHGPTISFRCNPHHPGSNPSGVTGAVLKRPFDLTEGKTFVAPFKPHLLRATASQLDRYLRPVVWHTDRLATALGALYSSLYSTFPEQGFLSLMTVIEALVKSRFGGVSQQVSERVAWLTADSLDTRLQVLEEMRHLYKVRNGLVHGEVHKVRGVLLSNHTYSTAKRIAVGRMDHLSLLGHARDTLLAAFAIAPYRAILQKSVTNNLTDELLDKYFLAASMAGSLPPTAL